jgi:glycosyltransferase involved in cell wall biosynthesis
MEKEIAIIVHTAPGLDDYTLHFVNALSTFARVGYVIDAYQRERYGNALSDTIIPILFHRPRRRHLWGFWEMDRVARAIRHFQPDIVHVQGYGLWESVLVRMLQGRRIVNTVHDPVNHMDYQTPLNNFLLRDMIDHAQAWVVHSEGLKQLLLENHPVAEKQVFVHPLGVYEYYTRFATANNSRQQYILFFGEPRLNKGFDLILRVFASIKDKMPGWRLVIAGMGKTPPGTETLIESLEGHIIRKSGFVPDAEVAQLFAQAGIVAMPYRHGSQSSILAIAAAFGCPVLATPVGNLPEILEDGKQAFFVRPGDEEDLARGLLALAHDSALRAFLGNNLKERAYSTWSWKEAAKSLVQFYEASVLSLPSST